MDQNPVKLTFIANWKMHGDTASVASFAKSLLSLSSEYARRADFIFCPPACYLAEAASHLTGAGNHSQGHLGAQAIHAEQNGAYTGAVSAAMLKDIGCYYTLVGHSEDRQIRHLSDEMVASQALAAQQMGITPVICIGESLGDYESGNTLEVLEQQIRALKPAIASGDYLLAYEPIWAIGTGKTPTLDDIEKAHQHCKRILREIADNSDSKDDSPAAVLYGGSVKSENVAGIVALSSVNGALIGSASLSEEGFAKLVQAALK